MIDLDARLAPAQAVANTVLAEGHVLYPYRASAMKNQMRWQFGILGPPDLAHLPDGEAPTNRTVCLARDVAGTIWVRARWLRPQAPDASGWQAAVHEHIDVACEANQTATASLGIVSVEVSATPIDATTTRVTVTMTNVAAPAEMAHEAPSDDDGRRSRRAAGLSRSAVGAHVLLALDHGAWVSAVDPPPDLAHLVDAADQDRLWPVLAGTGVMLACPVILYDQPTLAPEIVGDACDATEIEELLALRVATLTPAERDEARRTDPVAAEIVARHAHLDAEDQWRLHGRLTADDDGRGISVGDAVVLRPTRRADAHDLLLAGRRATVVGLETDAEGHRHVRVVFDDDPGRDLHEWLGRSWFFGVDEVEPA